MIRNMQCRRILQLGWYVLWRDSFVFLWAWLKVESGAYTQDPILMDYLEGSLERLLDTRILLLTRTRLLHGRKMHYMITCSTPRSTSLEQRWFSQDWKSHRTVQIWLRTWRHRQLNSIFKCFYWWFEDKFGLLLLIREGGHWFIIFLLLLHFWETGLFNWQRTEIVTLNAFQVISLNINHSIWLLNT